MDGDRLTVVLCVHFKVSWGQYFVPPIAITCMACTLVCGVQLCVHAQHYP